MIKNSTTDKIYSYLRNNTKMTHQGASAMLGNIYAESACEPRRIEELLAQRYNEDCKGNYSKYAYINGDYKRPVNILENMVANDTIYCSRLDSGAITFNEFLHPRAYTGVTHQYGFGLTQVTSPSRKQQLWNMATAQNKPLYDLDLQLEHLKYELLQLFPTTLSFLVDDTKTLKECSDRVLCKFEQPADADAMKDTRYKYSKYYYDTYNKKEDDSLSYDVNTLISIAKAEIGYKETNNNITKYWAELKPSYQGEPWCDCFVSWCFKHAFGSAADNLLCGGLYSFYTPTSAQYFKNKGQWHTTPQKGDVIYFKNSSRICHTGIVSDVKGSTVYTIEGNTSNGKFDADGGAVCDKSYDVSNSRIAGYGRPNYGAQTTATTTGGYMFEVKDIVKGSTGNHVKLFQKLANADGYVDRNGQKLEVDGSAGDKTIYVINQIQSKARAKGTELGTNGQNDSVCGAKCWKYILSL